MFKKIIFSCLLLFLGISTGLQGFGAYKYKFTNRTPYQIEVTASFWAETMNVSSDNLNVLIEQGETKTIQGKLGDVMTKFTIYTTMKTAQGDNKLEIIKASDKKGITGLLPLTGEDNICICCQPIIDRQFTSKSLSEQQNVGGQITASGYIDIIKNIKFFWYQTHSRTAKGTGETIIFENGNASIQE